MALQTLEQVLQPGIAGVSQFKLPITVEMGEKRPQDSEDMVLGMTVGNR